ncbi:MAG: DNA polymerase III subunit beta [Lachnospiraceae bacterium]|nr:DNA polymerase III subunit beta [Lachnospiraceae bacterium]
MRIVCTKSELVKSTSIVMKAVSTKTTMPILESILIESYNDTIKLTGNDMEMGIETLVKGIIDEEGTVLVEAKMFFEFVRKMPSDEIVIQSNDNQVILKSGKSEVKLAVKDKNEFPVLPDIVKSNMITISQFTLREMIRQTIHSISTNESSKLMTGELFEINGDELKVTSLDGYRISIRKVKLKESYPGIKVVIPGKTLNEITKIISGGIEDDVNIYFDEKNVLFEFDDTIVMSRLIEGEYYKIDQMLSGDYETKITINKSELFGCLDRATLLIRDSEKKPVVLNITDGVLRLELNSTLGAMDEDIEIIKNGPDIMIAFNPKFLMEDLRVIDDDTIDLYFINSKAPFFIKNDEGSYIYLIVPVRLDAVI